MCVCVCFLSSVIAAFAVATALGTDSQQINSGVTIGFRNIFTRDGISILNRRLFICPETAFYFVHYRLLVRSGPVDSMPCTVTLNFGGANDVILVSTVHSSQNGQFILTIKKKEMLVSIDSTFTVVRLLNNFDSICKFKKNAQNFLFYIILLFVSFIFLLNLE